MDTASKLAAIVGVMIVFIVAAAGVVAFFRANLAKAQIEDLRGDRDDLQKRADRLEHDLDAERTLRIAQDAEIKLLKEALSGKAQLDLLEQMLIAHDKRVEDRHKQVSDHFNRVFANQAGINEQNEKLIDSNKELQSALTLVLSKANS